MTNPGGQTGDGYCIDQGKTIWVVEDYSDICYQNTSLGLPGYRLIDGPCSTKCSIGWPEIRSRSGMTGCGCPIGCRIVASGQRPRGF